VNENRKEGTMRVKVTISREAHPALYEALFSISSPRRRMARFRDLVTMGLMVELNRVGVSPTLKQAESVPGPGAAGPVEASTEKTATSVPSMLEWDSSHS
jgi:hypothetical protein